MWCVPILPLYLALCQFHWGNIEFRKPSRWSNVISAKFIWFLSTGSCNEICLSLVCMHVELQIKYKIRITYHDNWESVLFMILVVPKCIGLVDLYSGYKLISYFNLTFWALNKMVYILQMALSDMSLFTFCIEFHWSWPLGSDGQWFFFFFFGGGMGVMAWC